MTDSSVLEVVDLDSLGLDFDAPCQHSAATGEPADWGLKCRACGNIAVMLCDDHLAAVRRDEADIIARAERVSLFGIPLARPVFGDSSCGFSAETIDAAFEVVKVR